MPVLARDAGVVKFAGEDFEGLAVEGEVVAFDGEGMLRCLCWLSECLECRDGQDDGKEGAELRFRGGFHGS